jgi:hypothetical protein
MFSFRDPKETVIHRSLHQHQKPDSHARTLSYFTHCQGNQHRQITADQSTWVTSLRAILQ